MNDYKLPRTQDSADDELLAEHCPYYTEPPQFAGNGGEPEAKPTPDLSDKPRCELYRQYPCPPNCTYTEASTEKWDNMLIDGLPDDDNK